MSSIVSWSFAENRESWKQREKTRILQDYDENGGNNPDCISSMTHGAAIDYGMTAV